MREAKETRPDTAIPGRAKMEAETGQATTSNTDSITQAAVGQSFRISDLLLHGQENAISMRHIKAITGMKGRAIRKMIETERRQGIPVLSDNISGYFLPKDEGEKDRFVKSMQHRAGEILKSAAAIERGEQ